MNMAMNLRGISKLQFLVGITAIVSVGIAQIILREIHWLFIGITIVPLFLGNYFYDRLSILFRSAWVGIVIGMIIVFAVIDIFIIGFRILNPQVWDFHVFYLNGKVAAEGYNFYESDSYFEVSQKYLNVDPANVDEILVPAFVYIPPSIFYFLPLGWFNINVAQALWYGIQLIFLVVSINILWRLSAYSNGWRGLLFVTALTLACFGTRLTLELSQLNYMMLCFALLFIIDHKHPRAGIWLAFGILAKPLLGVLLLYSLLKGHWKVILITILSLGVLCIATILVFGWETFFTFFTNSPYGRLPPEQYHHIFYQSWLAMTIRLTNYDVATGSALLQPIFLIPSLILTGITSIVVYRLNHQAELLLTLCLLLGLILYPHTQIYYSVLLLIAILLIWKSPPQNTRAIIIKLGFTIILFVLMAYDRGTLTFYAIILTWISILGHTIYLTLYRNSIEGS